MEIVNKDISIGHALDELRTYKILPTTLMCNNVSCFDPRIRKSSCFVVKERNNGKLIYYEVMNLKTMTCYSARRL